MKFVRRIREPCVEVTQTVRMEIKSAPNREEMKKGQDFGRGSTLMDADFPDVSVIICENLCESTSHQLVGLRRSFFTMIFPRKSGQ